MTLDSGPPYVPTTASPGVLGHAVDVLQRGLGRGEGGLLVRGGCCRPPEAGDLQEGTNARQAVRVPMKYKGTEALVVVDLLDRTGWSALGLVNRSFKDKPIGNSERAAVAGVATVCHDFQWVLCRVAVARTVCFLFLAFVLNVSVEGQH